MRHAAITLLFLLFGFLAHAQYSDHRDWNIDSLENVVATWTPERLATASFETKAAVGRAFSDLMYAYERINPERSMYCARRSFAITDKLGSLYRPYLAAKCIGKAYYQSGQYDSTIFYYKIALSYLDRMAAGEAGPDTPEGYSQDTIDDAYSSFYGNLGNLYYDLDSIPQTLHYFALAGEIFEKHGWKSSSAVLYNNLGTIWEEQGDFNKAIDCYKTALRYGTEAGDSLWIASPKLGLGGVYFKQGRTTKALKYLQEAGEYYTKHQDQEYNDLIATLDFTSQVYAAQKRQRTLLAVGAIILALALLALLLISRRSVRLGKANKAADEAIAEALELHDEIPGQVERPELSEGEAKILPMIAAGLTSKEIAAKLFLTEQTIKWRRQRLVAKFDAKNTAEMLSKAKEAGML